MQNINNNININHLYLYKTFDTNINTIISMSKTICVIDLEIDRKSSKRYKSLHG